MAAPGVASGLLYSVVRKSGSPSAWRCTWSVHWFAMFSERSRMQVEPKHLRRAPRQSRPSLWRNSMDVRYDKLLTVEDRLSQEIISGLEFEHFSAQFQKRTLG